MPRPCPQTRLVDCFLMELYQSAAEPLPDGFCNDGIWDANDTERSADHAAQVWNPDQPLPDELRALSAEVLGVPVRHLPPGRVHDLYLQFLAWWDEQRDCANVEGVAGEPRFRTPPSVSTFHKQWSQKWHHVLKFRQAAQHSYCQTCFELKQAMEGARGDLVSKVQIARDLRRHIRSQYQDRVVYWSQRWASRQMQDILVIIIDSMDKTKFAIPRYPFPEKPKELEGFNRPKLVCTAALAHGWATCVYLADEDQPHGGDTFCEVLFRVLEEVAQVAQVTGKPMPRHLVVQADNTTAQCKNHIGTLVMAMLVAKFKFITANLQFLRVGHTHEDVGAPLRLRGFRSVASRMLQEGPKGNASEQGASASAPTTEISFSQSWST